MKKNRTSHATIVKRSFKVIVLLLFLAGTFVLSHLGYACGVLGNTTWRISDPAFANRFVGFTSEPGLAIVDYAAGAFLSFVTVWILCGIMIAIDQSRFPTMREWKTQRELPTWDD
jgi:hypothetical protein